MGSERRESIRDRTEVGLTGAVLARRAGAGQPTVSRAENGRMVPSLDVLGRWSLAEQLRPGADFSA
ncbi:helix-turn-helix domain-containing protein, partial [Streptomyces sp. NPDC057456]|uniref:helix-turn-helix domain-containing protein n=1 Tax=Streptomyces sp. NPDC057456 TaxID=3346139 RepID=UPI0036889965